MVKEDCVGGKINVLEKRVGFKEVNTLFFREILEVLHCYH